MVTFALDFITFYGMYVAISVSLNLEFGYAGIPNFGKVLFIAAGAAFAGSISGRLAAYLLNVPTHGDFITFNPTIIIAVNTKIPGHPELVVGILILAIVIGAAVGGLFGYLASFPAIRLREDYLGMLLLAVAQFWQVIMLNYSPLTGGNQNIAVPNIYQYFTNLGIGWTGLVEAIVMGVFAILVFSYAERLGRSPLGRTLKAVRESEDAARALGKNDTKFRRNILIVASAIAGIAGALYSFQIAAVTYDTWTRFDWTFWPFLIVIIGGIGNNVGVAVGAFFFTLFYRGLLLIQPNLQPYLGGIDPNWLTYLLFAGLLITILAVRPEGLVPEKSAPTLSRSKLSSIVSAALGPGGGPLPQGGRLRRLFGRLRRRKNSEPSETPPS